ncbi:MAG: hypothetical protein PHY16_13580 [Methylobacter sp.]|nr:hypothetical protein [Methylobacter sp.]
MKILDFFSNRSQMDGVDQFQLFLDKSSNALMFFNADLEINKVSQSAVKLFREHWQVFQKTAPDFDLLQPMGARLDNFIAIPETVFSELRQLKSWANFVSLGEEKLHVSLLPLADKQGMFKGGVFEFWHATDYLKLEEASVRAKSILQHLITPVMTCDVNRVITSVNPSLIYLLNSYKAELQKAFPVLIRNAG